MAVRLRTRLFLVVAAVLGASILVSALLSRRATLVEIQTIENRASVKAPAAPVLDRGLQPGARECTGDPVDR